MREPTSPEKLRDTRHARSRDFSPGDRGQVHPGRENEPAGRLCQTLQERKILHADELSHREAHHVRGLLSARGTTPETVAGPQERGAEIVGKDRTVGFDDSSSQGVFQRRQQG